MNNNNITEPPEMAAAPAANNWGHNKEKPRFHLATKPGRARPAQIQKLEAAAFKYYATPFILPTLANLSEKTNLDGSPRCNRSDGREAESLLMAAIINSTEFASLRVGTPKAAGGFVNRSCRELARMSGLLEDPTDEQIERRISPNPSQRFWRAFRRLKAAGMFTVSRQYEKNGIGPDGLPIYKARPAIKALNINFLLSFNVLDSIRLKAFRDHCSKQVKKAAKDYAKTTHDSSDAIRSRQILGATQSSQGIKTKPKTRQAASNAPDLQGQYSDRKVRMQADFIKQGKARDKIPGLIRSALGTLDEYLAKHSPA